MNFKEYDEIIKKHKYDMLFLIIYYSLQYDTRFLKLNDYEKAKLIDFIYNTYLKDENNIDLGHICYVAFENKKEIFKNNFSYFDLLERC